MNGNGPDICLTGYWPSVAMSSRRRDGGVGPTCKAWAIVLSMHYQCRRFVLGS